MTHALDDARAAGRLIQWALRPRERPAQEPEYLALVNRYLDDSAFKALVQAVAAGLGLAVLDVGQHGVIVAAESDDSPFALRPADFRPGTRTVDERLLDGIVQIGIAATVFPRARDLEDEATVARPPVTIEEVDDNLRALRDRLAEAARGTPDPLADDELAGLEEAWRLYQRRLSAAATRDNRQSEHATRRRIEVALERLVELGCFVRQVRGERAQYQPTWRYQVLVRDLAASRLYASVRRRLETAGSA
jgi:hypothetical protein